MIELVFSKPRVLPPKGLLIALVAQIPLLMSEMPLRLAILSGAAGGILLAGGFVLNVWAERLFKRDNVGICPFTPAAILVRRGPYRVTRNPMYLGLIMITAGVAVLTGVLANLWSAVALSIWLHYAFVLPEEVFLRRELGRDFEAYVSRVPRWLLR
jgi:protein-S-isoprenylcysteine O-methyltransferase Ste14